MKNTIASLIFFFVCFLCNSCSKNNIGQNKLRGEYNLKVADCTQETNGTQKYTVCFNRMINDSRCPADVVCITGGSAEAEFTLSYGSQKKIFNLSVGHRGSSQGEITIHGVHIVLVDILPYPISTLPQSNITAIIKISQ